MEVINDFLGNFVVLDPFGHKLKTFETREEAYGFVREWEER